MTTEQLTPTTPDPDPWHLGNQAIAEAFASHLIIGEAVGVVLPEADAKIAGQHFAAGYGAGQLAALSRFRMHDLTMKYDDLHWFPFVEDEDGNITGPGHQDKDAFAALVNHYDAVATDEPPSEPWTAHHVGHRWVLVDPTKDLLVVDGVTAATEHAIPVTTLWGER